MQHLGRRISAAILVASTAVAAASPGWAATEAAPGNGFTVGGKAIQLSTASGDGTRVEPGQFNFTLPADQTKRYLSVDYAKGERLELGLAVSSTWKNNGWEAGSSSDSIGVSADLLAPDGSSCAHDSASQSGSYATPGLLRLSLNIDPDGSARTSSSVYDACKSASKFTLELKRTDSGSSAGDLAAQLAVVRAPKPTNAPGPNDFSSLPALDTTPLQADSSVEAGSGFSNATILTPGGYTVKANPGRRSFYRVHLSYGQRMSVGWQMPKNGTQFKPAKAIQSTLQILSPTFVPVGDFGDNNSQTASLSPDYASGEPQEMRAHTAPVDFGNMNLPQGSGSGSAQWTTNPGWYYVVLDTYPDNASDGIDTSTNFDTALSIRVDQQKVTAPEFAVAQPSAGKVSGEATQSGTPIYVWLPITLLLLGGVGVLGYIMWRRNQKA